MLVYWGVSNFQSWTLLSVGEAAPPLELLDESGQEVSLSQFRGKTVILHFWATWCGVCVQELSMLKEFQRELPKDTVLLTVVADGDSPDFSSFVAKHEIDYPVLIGTAELIKRFKISAFPTNYFIDTAGVVRDRSVGISSRLGFRTRASCAH